MFIEVPASIKSKSFRRPLSGVGINDADYNVEMIINGKQVKCRYYSRWRGVIDRYYNKVRLQRVPAYSDCTVCD